MSPTFAYVLRAGFTQSAGERRFVHDIRPSCQAEQCIHITDRFYFRNVTGYSSRILVIEATLLR